MFSKKSDNAAFIFVVSSILLITTFVCCFVYLHYKNEEEVEIVEEDIYSVEIYDDGKVEVITDQRYINQIDEHTIIITDINFDKLEKVLMDMQDLGGE